MNRREFTRLGLFGSLMSSASLRALAASCPHSTTVVCESGPSPRHVPTVKVIAIGTGGINAAKRLREALPRKVEFLGLGAGSRPDRDADFACRYWRMPGWGTGADPGLGKFIGVQMAAGLGSWLHGTDVLFVVAGMGGGMGTGAAPVIARHARQVHGIRTVGIVSRPFPFEGIRRAATALDGIDHLRRETVALLTVTGEQIIESLSGKKNISLLDAFDRTGWLMRSAAIGIYGATTQLWSLDGAADVLFGEEGMSSVGFGYVTADSTIHPGSGSRPTWAVVMALSDNHFDLASLVRGRCAIVCLESGVSLTEADKTEATGLVREHMAKNAAVLVIDRVVPEHGQSVHATVIA